MEFWDSFKNIYPESGVSYGILLRNAFSVRTLFTRYEYEINVNVGNYLTTLQQNPDPRVYYFLEGLKDSLVYFHNLSPLPNNQPCESTNVAAKKLVREFCLSTKNEWTATLYQSSISRVLLLMAVIQHTEKTENDSAYISGVMVLY